MTTPTRNRFALFPGILLLFAVLITLTLVTTACSSSDTGGSTPPAANTSTIMYSSGKVFSTGPIDGQGRRQDAWTLYFESGPVWWEARYSNDVFDPSQSWTEYNADGSVRYAASDGAPPHQPPTTPPSGE